MCNNGNPLPSYHKSQKTDNTIFRNSNPVISYRS